MLRIGLTGGIGSGKSTVAGIFKVLGIPVYMADDATRQLMNDDHELKKAILHEFGEQSYTDGRLNRSYLASIVFNDPARLDRLNALTHPVTIRHANEWMLQQKAPYVIKEAALIFESGSGENLDYIIGVYAPRTIRIKRVMDRDGISREEVIKRMNRQIDEELKMKLCDFVLVNDEQQLLIPQVLALDEKFRSMTSVPA
ncbi:MAG TPA: dephospho-CoA kinase [Chitinophagaceae bacterium]|nr:dephospho-CoA kinase [Chitinophagaceae bacterium]